MAKLKRDPFTILSGLRAWQLKHLAFLTGVNSSGTKAQLCRTLLDNTKKAALPEPRCRVLSVDMGVKNLAFCVLDLQKLPQDDEQSVVHDNNNTLSLHLTDWKRLDVSERMVTRDNPVDTKTSDPSRGDIVDKTTYAAETTPGDQPNIYSPSSLSKIAFNLASEFLRYEPDYILIERQRFRSGGAPSIQEWTVRVNMLEKTMRRGHEKDLVAQKGIFPEVLEMSPRRVGMFWLARKDFFPNPADIATSLTAPIGCEQTTETEVKKKSFEKKDKIALAQHWLSLSMTTDDMTVDAGIAPMVAMFCSPKVRRSRRRDQDNESEEEAEGGDVAMSGKLDDLADCLVQGVTFGLWEQNRTRVREYLGHQESS
ncbi:ribonuclease H-like protein [Aureobasidium subglaciale]|nr:ribonuclease H-like protein [Aureobasidium subglaciale]KAI5230420.1 ribonuclease H-like protein [Aureobasidium subglaciale]KAI5233557.1 ribonuclease H-like protein [Aureobasidium subglaciale]KAI5266938.1 ribonuclease H-like protein [Aureobasidium subglaciale]